MRFSFLSCSMVFALVVAACAPQPPAQQVNSEWLPGSETAERASMTRQQCSQAGGFEVGDIGDGRIHRPSYRCANGQPPIATVIANSGEPIAIEGSVCCVN